MKYKRVHIFLKGICPKMNVMEQLEFELAYNNVIVKHFNHYSTVTPSELKKSVIY